MRTGFFFYFCFLGFGVFGWGFNMVWISRYVFSEWGLVCGEHITYYIFYVCLHRIFFSLGWVLRICSSILG